MARELFDDDDDDDEFAVVADTRRRRTRRAMASTLGLVPRTMRRVPGDLKPRTMSRAQAKEARMTRKIIAPLGQVVEGATLPLRRGKALENEM